MCGIAGIIAPNAVRYRSILQAMVDSIKHRGPDGEGFHFFSDCALGHRRLAIVDIAGGAQPMLSPDSRVGLVLNGEIYGFKNIQQELDYAFFTACDTEVVLALYDRYGTEMLSRLPGMFAFALWDDQKKRLFCARDRFGEKPFFYAFLESGEFIYASEIKAIIASGLVKPKIDKSALRYYLQNLYIPVDKTIFENIYSLPPAHALVFQDGQCKTWRYWDLPVPTEQWSLTNAAERFRELLSQAVNRQLVADVEVAAFLSGGLDSSTVVYEAARQKTDLRTISFGFTSGFDERPYAKAAAERYGTQHIELVEESLPVSDLLLRMAKIYDEPFADSSNIPTYLISEQAARYVRVVLSGDGGDELLGGYEGWYQPLLRTQRKSRNRFRSWVCYTVLRVCRKAGFCKSDLLGASIHEYRRILAFTGIASSHSTGGFFPEKELDACGLPQASSRIEPPFYGGVDDALRLDIANYMPGDILVKTDRAAMANGLELRAPFLDVDLASFLIALPHSLKVNESESKILLRAAYAQSWPEEIQMRSKQGFGSPVTEWFQRPDMRQMCNEYFAPNKKIYSLLPAVFIKKYISADAYQKWILLVLSLWCEGYGSGC
jgi:asparagine synthase (glutamine-hydrolysing)